MLQIPNILTRFWTCTLTETSVTFEGRDVEGKEKREEVSGRTSTLPLMAATWLREKILMNEFPFVYVKKTFSTGKERYLFIICSCLDNFFLHEALFERKALYRNSADSIHTFLLDEACDITALRKKWNFFFHTRQILRFSRRLLLEAKQGKKLLHCMTLPAEILNIFLSYNFVWNRDENCWNIPDDEKTDSFLQNLFQDDRMPFPEGLGFVPEYYLEAKKQGFFYTNKSNGPDPEIFKF